jgi:ABC-type amino acid transport substrate-binding protein
MKTNFKKTIALLGALTFMLTAVTACGDSKSDSKAESSASSAAEQNVSDKQTQEIKTGVLSLLRMDEETYSGRSLALTKGIDYLADKDVITVYDKDGNKLESLPKKPENASNVYYDSLDTMIMAMEKGDIDRIELTQTVAEYVVSRNDKLYLRFKTDTSKADEFDKNVIDRLSHGYSFMMLEDKTALRDEFNTVIRAIEDDGTLDKLKKTYIDDVIAGKDPEPVQFEKTDGETIKVAVTGSLPPMDYIAPDGTPAGYNTALLAEIGKRTGKNIELVQVDSIGRAAALSSGTVDVAFWTRSSSDPNVGKTEEEHKAFIEEKKKNYTDEQNSLMKSIKPAKSYTDELQRDMPDGTICTARYFADPITIVALK